MKIDLTKKQYKLLIELISAGEFLVNGHKFKDYIDEYSDLEKYILSFYNDFYEEIKEEHIIEKKIEEKMFKYYDEAVKKEFNEKLAMILSSNELKNNGKSIEYEDVLDNSKKYIKEFNRNGFERLELNWNKKLEYDE
ncbi:MAG: hypothetical protein FH751_07330 [Firmicutes bacterium]|nr:hypothetical protein [Bacillota bacterium]